MTKELGLFYPDGSFESDDQIKRRLALQNQSSPVFETPLATQRDFNYWSTRFKNRQREYSETVSNKNFVTVSFPDDPIINFISDIHAGSPQTHYDRLEAEIRVILTTPNSYVAFMGDVVDGFFFNPAQMEQIEQAPEQFQYANALLRLLAQHKRLLFGFSGQHDSWIRKMGYDPQARFAEELGSFYFQGVGHIEAKVGNALFKIIAAHNLPGFSMYNNVHPQMRASKEIQGADIYVAGDTHVKGYGLQSVKEFGGKARKVHYISLGTYKTGDEYSRKKGFNNQSPQEMYGAAVVLRKNGKIEYYDDILEANMATNG